MELPSPHIFSAILSGSISKLWEHPRSVLNPFLPLLCKVVFQPTPTNQDPTVTWVRYRKALHSLLLDIEPVNRVQKYLQLDFAELNHDAIKEQQLLKKLRPGEEQLRSESVLVSSLENGILTEFERGGIKRRFRLVLSEMLRLINQVY